MRSQSGANCQDGLKLASYIRARLMTTIVAQRAMSCAEVFFDVFFN
jgi:hypothetical protein